MTRAEDQDEVVYKPTTESELFQKLKPQNEKKKDTCLFLYFTSIVVNLLPLTTGMAVTWTSPVSLKLLSSDPIINPLGKPVTTLQLSFIGSFPSLGAISGLMLLGSCFDIYGRKKIMIALSSLLAVSYIILAFSTNIYFYYASMVAIGLALGVGTAGTTLYCSEITEDHNRSKFICFIGLSLPLGNLLAFVLGPFFSVKVFSLMCSIPSFIYFFLKTYYESGTILQNPIHDGSETAAYHLLIDCYAALSDKWDTIEKFMDTNEYGLMKSLGRKRFNDIYEMYENSRVELLAQIENGGMEIEMKAFNMWKELHALVPDKLAELSIDQLANSQKLFEMIQSKHGIAPPQDLEVKSQVVGYFTNVLEKLKPTDFAEIDLFKNVISKPDYSQIVEADGELFSFINKTKETILSSIDNRAEEICGIIGTETGIANFTDCSKLKMQWLYLKVKLWSLNYEGYHIISVNPMYLYAVCALVLLLVAAPFVLRKYRVYEAKKLLSMAGKGVNTVTKPQFQSDPIHPNPVLMI